MLNQPVSARSTIAGLAIIVFGLGLPVAMVFANRSAPVVLLVATILGLAAVVTGGGWGELLWRHQVKLRTPAAVAALVFAAVAVSSLTWSIDRDGTARALVGVLLMVYCGLVAACALPLVAGRSSGWLLVAGVAVGALLVIVEVMQGMRWHGWLGERMFTFELKRSLVVLVLLFWPAAGFLLGRGRRLWAAGLAILLLAATQLVGAGTATLGLAMGAIAFAGARFAARRTLVAAMIFVAAALVTAPFIGSLASHIWPSQAVRIFVRSHAVERIAIWHAFGTRFLDRPIVGYGFDASARVATIPRPAGDADPASDATIERVHPHNGYLQIWVEEGAVGALAAAPLFIAIFFALARLPRDRLPLPLALLLSAASMAMVGFGLWQTWWIASVASAIIWMAVNDRSAGTAEVMRG